jgi:hypothetical protein
MASVTGVSPESTLSTIKHLCCAIWSISSDFKSHLGVVRGRCLRDPPRRRGFFISLLPSERNRLFHLAQPHHQPRPGQHDREVPLAQAAHQVEGLALRSLLGQGQRVVGHALFDGRPHLRRRPEEAIRRHRTPDPLVRTPEVVGLHEERDPPLAILEVGKDRAREKFLPQRLPEALDLAQRLRMVRPALDVTDALTTQLLLEVGVPAPGHVLTSLIRQHLPRRAVLGDAARQRLQDQRRPLVMRHHQGHQVARVVVHEGRHVQPLLPSQQKREDVRLPKLVRFGTLESVLGWTRLGQSLGYALQ